MKVSDLARMFSTAALLLSVAAHAQSPATIRVILPQPAGSGTDIAIRLVTERMAASLRQNMVIDNRPGAGGILAAEAAARSPADGLTLFACTSTTQVMLPLVTRKLPYDAEHDFVPLGIISKADNIVVVPAGSPFKTIAELVAYGKANPGKLSFGTAGIGTTHHLAAELLQQQGGFVAMHVPYRGTPLAEGDLIGGRLDFMINNTAVALPNIQAGKTRALMVTSARRTAELPDTPTSHEAGFPDFEVYGFTALCAPAGTPRPALDRISRELQAAVALPDVRERLVKLGFDGRASSPQEQADYVRREKSRWGQLIRAKGMTFD